MHRESVRSSIKNKMVPTNATIRHVPIKDRESFVDDDTLMEWYGRKYHRPDQVLAKKEGMNSKGKKPCGHVGCNRKIKDNLRREGKNKLKKIKIDLD